MISTLQFILTLIHYSIEYHTLDYFLSPIKIDIHISYIIKSTMCHKLYKIHPIMHIHKAILSNSLILSQLSYFFMPIHVQVNRNYRLRRKHYNTGITYLRRKLKWIYTTYDINLKILTLLFKTITNNLPANLCELIHIKPPNKVLRSSISPRNLNPPLNLQDSKIAHSSQSSARLWTSLNHKSRSSSTKSFKKYRLHQLLFTLLIVHLVSNYFLFNTLLIH